MCVDGLSYWYVFHCTYTKYTVQQLYNETDFILTKIEVLSMKQCMPSMWPTFICNLATPQRPTLSMTGNMAPFCAGSEKMVVTVAAWSRERTLHSVLSSGKLQQRLWNWWDKCTGIIVYLVHRYSGGMHDSKVVWKWLKMKPGLGVHFVFVTRDSLRKWENEYKKNVVWLWEWWLMGLVLTGRWFVKS